MNWPVIRHHDTNTIYTRITHGDDCCGCINVTEGDNFNLIMTCNECGKVVGTANIPHERPSTPVAAQGQQKNPFPPACMHGVALTVFCLDCSVGNAPKGEAAQGGTQETTKEQRLIDLENELKYANAALGGNPAIQLCDRIRILKAGVAASQDTTKAKKEK